MNPAYSYTPDDQMNPVYCIGCRQHIPDALSKMGRGLCPECLAKIAGAQQPPRQPAPSAPMPPRPAPPVQVAPMAVPMYHAPAYAPPRRMNDTTKLCLAVGALVLFVGYAGISSLVHSSQDKNRRASYATLLAKLQKDNPDRRFAIYAGTVPINAQLISLRVDKLSLSRDGESVNASVTFTGTGSQEIAPEVYVSLYDGKGTMLGREAVVNHTFADLRPGVTDTTEDAVKIGNAEPVIVGVDDDPEKRRAEIASKEEKAAEVAQERAATAAEERVRGPKPVPSGWDTICPEANAWMKANLKDYDSLKIVNGSDVVPYGQDAWCQRIKYRARNGFGGYVLDEKVFVIRNGEVTNVLDY